MTLLATSLIQFPISSSRISVPFLWHCKSTVLHIAVTYTWKTPDTSRHSISNSNSQKRKRFKGILIWQGRCRIICYLELRRRYIIVVNFWQQRTEGIFFSKTRICKYSSRFQVSWVIGSFWKPKLVDSLQKVLSGFSPRALLLTMQSCKPENPSKHHTTWGCVGRKVSHASPNVRQQSGPTGHKGEEFISQMVCTTMCGIWCSTETSQKKRQNSNPVWCELVWEHSLLCCTLRDCFTSSAPHGQPTYCKSCSRNCSFDFKNTSDYCSYVNNCENLNQGETIAAIQSCLGAGNSSSHITFWKHWHIYSTAMESGTFPLLINTVFYQYL